DGGKALRITLERKSFLDQLLAEIARHERIVGMIGGAGHYIRKPDILIAPGEQPEIIALAVMLLAEHAADGGAFLCELANVWRVEPAAEDLLHILVLFDDDDNVIVNRQRRWPGDPV